jgi:lysophospholipase
VQGLSGRWLSEPQFTWIHSFEDYVDDFVFFVTTVIPNEKQSLPKYILAHSMGGLISAIAMSRHPTQFRRAVLCAPMLRNKCGMKCTNYVHPFPQPVAYYLTMFSCWLGMGTKPALGYFKEKPSDMLPVCVATSDEEQLTHWQLLREKYPQLMATCVTNDWVVKSIKAQKKFANRFQFVRTNT